ncbi:MAG: thioredoxin [Butyricicoccaceae bacterium]
MAVTVVTAESFEREVIGSERPVLVDYWAEWCPPCKAMAPAIQALDEELGAKLKVCKVNIDDHPTLALLHKVVSIPTLCLYKDGQEVKRLIGLRELDEVKQELLPFLAD